MVLVTSDRYQLMHLPNLITSSAAHNADTWAKLRPNSADAKAGFLRDMITIVQKLLALDPDTDDPLRASTANWPGYNNDGATTLNTTRKAATYMEVNEVMWAQQNAEKWSAATNRQKEVWKAWEDWWAVKKQAPRWNCINDNVCTFGSKPYLPAHPPTPLPYSPHVLCHQKQSRVVSRHCFSFAAWTTLTFAPLPD